MTVKTRIPGIVMCMFLAYGCPDTGTVSVAENTDVDSTTTLLGPDSASSREYDGGIAESFPDVAPRAEDGQASDDAQEPTEADSQALPTDTTGMTPDVESPTPDGLEEEPPLIVSTTIEPTMDWGLGAFLSVSTDSPATLEVSIEGSEGLRKLPATAILTESPATMHQVLLLQNRPESEYQVRIVATGENGASSEAETSFQTESLPSNFPILTFTPHAQQEASDGITVMAIADTTQGMGMNKTSFLTVLDSEGQVVGYRPFNPQRSMVVPRKGGGWYALQGKNSLQVLNLWGEAIETWSAQDFGTDSFHHEVHELPDGRLAILGTEARQIDGFPGEDSPLDIIGDLLLELDPETGTLSTTWALLDLLDPYRVIAGFDTNFWNNTYPDLTPKDWSHANSIFLSQDQEAYILSIRNQNLVGRFHRETGDLEWAIGAPSSTSSEDDDWPWLTLPSGDKLPAQQHSASELSNGNILLYDNGTDQNVSYGVEYAINTEEMTTEVVWTWTDPQADPPIFSRNGGNTVIRPNNNVLLTHSQLSNGGTGNNQSSYSLLQEVSRNNGTQKVWDMKIEHTNETGSIRVYRAFHMDSLYP